MASVASRACPAGPSEPGYLKPAAAFAAIYLIWGATFLAIRVAVETLPPLLMMGTRHLAAGILLLLWQLGRGEWRAEPRLWLSALFSGGFCFLGSHGLMAWAEVRVPSGLAALLAATLPIWMILLARIRGRESELTPPVLTGVALGFAGVGLLIPLEFRGPHPEGPGALAILLCEVCWAVGAIYARGVKTAASPSTFACMQMLAGGGWLWMVGLGMGEGARLSAAAFTTRAVLALGFLIVFGSLVAFTAYTWLLQVSSPAVVSTHSYVNPLVAVLLGWALAGERIAGRTVAGAAIVLASVAVVSGRGRSGR